MPKESERKVTKKNESLQRIKAWFGRGPLVERGAHASGCACGFCKNKGKIADHWKKKIDDAGKSKKDEEKEPKGVTEGLEKQLKAVLGETNVQGAVHLSTGSTKGPANRAYHNMSSKQAMTPEWKPKAFQRATAEATNQTGRLKGFRNEGEGETTSGKALKKTRAGESALKVVTKLLDD